MIAVIFEVEPHEQHRDAYFDIAGNLRPSLVEMDGFISVERFASVTQPGKYLALSFWRDESAVQAWRLHGQHREAQARGRAELFRDYRLRVAAVIRDYGMKDRKHAPPITA